jgi:hypothetical protein
MVAAGVMSADQRVQVIALPRALHWVDLSLMYCNSWLILGYDSRRVVSATVDVGSAVGGRQWWVDGFDGDWGERDGNRKAGIGNWVGGGHQAFCNGGSAIYMEIARSGLLLPTRRADMQGLSK